MPRLRADRLRPVTSCQAGSSWRSVDVPRVGNADGGQSVATHNANDVAIVVAGAA